MDHEKMEREFQEYMNAADQPPYVSFDVLTVKGFTRAEFLKANNPQIYKQLFDTWLIVNGYKKG